MNNGAFAVFLVDDDDTLIERFSRAKAGAARWTYLPKELLNRLNVMLKGMLERIGYTTSRTSKLCSDGERYIIQSCRGEVSADVSLNMGDVETLIELNHFAEEWGYSGIECIMFSPRTAGKYKSACLGRSKEEEGCARVTLDMH